MSTQEMEHHFKIINLYINNAKSYIQISSGALILPIFFLKEITGQEYNPEKINFMMVAAWMCFLITIGAGLLYQYLAVKFLDYLAQKNVYSILPEWMVKSPGRIYGLMLISFYLAAVAFVVFAISLITF